MPKIAIDEGIPDRLNLRRTVRAAHGIRTLTKADLKYNGETPDIQVDPQTYTVTVNGEVATCEPSTVLPMAQRYFLF
jgi:urease subunit alpha